jgi:hypothetical protein
MAFDINKNSKDKMWYRKKLGEDVPQGWEQPWMSGFINQMIISWE